MREIISAVASIDDKNGLGRDNQMAWHIREDLLHFKELTKDKVVVIGSNTFDSMEFYYNRSGRKMPAKKYIVLTGDKERKTNRDNVDFAYSLEEAFASAHTFGEPEIFIAGGAYVFRETLGMVDRIYLTQVTGDYGCDTFFPDHSDFDEISSKEGEENGIKFSFKVLERKKSASNKT